MSPEPQNTQHTLPRSRVVEVIERTTADALRQLRAAGIPETEALAVIQRFSVFSVQVLRELDHLYQEYEQLLASDPDRSKVHQEWLDTKVGGMQLTIEAFIAALVAGAINKAKEDYRTELSRSREVITMLPRPLLWEQALTVLARQFRDPVVRWSVGYSAWCLLWYFAIGSVFAGLLAVAITAVVVYFFEKAGLLFILIAGVTFLLLRML